MSRRWPLWPLVLVGLLAIGATSDAAGDAAPGGLQLRGDDPRLQRAGRRWLISGVPFTGTILMMEPYGGRARLPVVAGLLQGVVRSSYLHGSRRSERAYVRGEKDGLQREWWPDGQLRMRAIMAHDRIVGSMQTWYADGHPFEEKQYADGQEAGLQRVFDRSGELRANYIIRDGRRYGFVMPTACTELGGGQVLP
jgi:hypothetical protein